MMTANDCLELWRGCWHKDDAGKLTLTSDRGVSKVGWCWRYVDKTEPINTDYTWDGVFECKADAFEAAFDTVCNGCTDEPEYLHGWRLAAAKYGVSCPFLSHNYIIDALRPSQFTGLTVQTIEIQEAEIPFDRIISSVSNDSLANCINCHQANLDIEFKSGDTAYFVQVNQELPEGVRKLPDGYSVRYFELRFK